VCEYESGQGKVRIGYKKVNETNGLRKPSRGVVERMRDCGRNRVRVRVRSRSRVKVRKYATKVQLLLPETNGLRDAGGNRVGSETRGCADAGETECIYE
jgi:hypothetical protein